jgi:O-antigen/teichoic acid export membrane protein
MDSRKGYKFMANRITPIPESTMYQIRIKGHLGRQAAVWFAGLSITLEDNGDTLLIGPVVDQAALYGLLRTVRDLGMPLLLVMQLQPDRAHAPDSQR